MSSADRAKAFYREVAVSHEVYGLEFDDTSVDVPLWPLGGGRTARPFWSSRRRINDMLSGPLASKRLRIVAFTWEGFVDGIAPKLEADGILVGLNWHGPRANGYNVPIAHVIAAVEAAAAPDQPETPAPPRSDGDTPSADDSGEIPLG